MKRLGYYKEKMCVNCGLEYLPTSGHQKVCKNCKSICDKQTLTNWRKQNKEKIQQQIEQRKPELRKYARKYYQQNPKSYFKYYIKKYGLSLADFDRLFELQKGRCAICNCLPSEKNRIGVGRLLIDHDHKTKKVRGLLCDKCNKGLGNFCDNVIFLQQAINYLKNEKLAKCVA